jgi:acetyltransferase-like isoleucine patch superfamily enzyme
MKAVVKSLVEFLALLAVLPAWLLYGVLRLALGRDRACQAISQRASRWPGVGGEYLRSALLRRVVAHVGRGVVISFGSVLTKASARLEDGVYVGSYCLIGDVRVGRDTLIADHVLVPSGSRQHEFERLDVPIRQQQGRFETIRIGCDCWIGSGAIILADVGDHCVVAAGSVVTHPVAEYLVVAGVPAQPIGDRRAQRNEAPARLDIRSPGRS